MSNKQIFESNGSKYLGEFMKDLPDNSMFNKVTTGSGMTSVVLKNDVNYVLAVPFVALIKNKEKWCQDKGIKYCSVYYGGANEDDVMNFKGKKIMVTYDSLSKVTKCLEERGDIKKWKLCVDECHKLVDSAAFRPNAINNVINNFNKYGSYIFGTATPVKDEYQLPALKNIPKAEVKWDNLEKVNVNYCHIDNKINDVAAVLALDFLNGKRSGNAHIFINSVTSIADIIRKMLKGGFENFKDVRIVCADNTRNERIIETKISKEFCISAVGSDVRKVNFYTATAFEGCDIYDSEGKNFIITDGNKDFTKIDIVTILPQIIGRVRDSKYKNSVDLLFTKNRYLYNVSEEEFSKQVIKNIEIAKKDVEIFYELKNELSNIPDAMIKYDSPYFLSVGDELIVNENAWYNEMHNFNTIHSTYYVSSDGNNSFIQDGMKTYNSISYDYSKIKSIQIKGLNKKKIGKVPCFKDLCLDIIEILESENIMLRSGQIVEIKKNYPLIYEMYNTFGVEKMKALNFRKKNFKKALLIASDEKSVTHKIIKLLDLRIGVWYSCSNIKLKLKGIYNDINLMTKAKATDLNKWFNLRESCRRVDGKIMSGYVIVGQKVKYN
jgi:hypothetical protein